VLLRELLKIWAACLDYQILLNSWESVGVALILDAFVRIFLAFHVLYDIVIVYKKFALDLDGKCVIANFDF
jgi:hypothetical protein